MDSEPAPVLSYQRSEPVRRSGRHGSAWGVAMGGGLPGAVVLALYVVGGGGGPPFLLGSMIVGFVAGAVGAMAVRRHPLWATLAGSVMAVTSVLSIVVLSQWLAGRWTEREVNGKLFLICFVLAVLVGVSGLIGGVAVMGLRRLLDREGRTTSPSRSTDMGVPPRT